MIYSFLRRVIVFNIHNFHFERKEKNLSMLFQAKIGWNNLQLNLGCGTLVEGIIVIPGKRINVGIWK